MDFVFTEEGENGEMMKVRYCPISGERYGIRGILDCGGETEETASPGLFFTEQEAMEWCSWLTRNKVLPLSLKQVLSDEFYI